MPRSPVRANASLQMAFMMDCFWAAAVRISTTSFSGWMVMCRNFSASSLLRPRARATVPPRAPAVLAAAITSSAMPCSTTEMISSNWLFSVIGGTSLSTLISARTRPPSVWRFAAALMPESGTVNAIPLPGREKPSASVRSASSGATRAPGTRLSTMSFSGSSSPR